MSDTQIAAKEARNNYGITTEFLFNQQEKDEDDLGHIY